MPDMFADWQHYPLHCRTWLAFYLLATVQAEPYDYIQDATKEGGF